MLKSYQKIWDCQFDIFQNVLHNVRNS